MSTRKKVLVKTNQPLLDLGKIKKNVYQVLESTPNGIVVEASQFQIEMLKAEGFEVLEEISE